MSTFPMRTSSGRLIWPFAPDPASIVITDIAHALSQICRFGGQTREFYSVAQHSVLVSQACGEDDALWGLLHDASEAYLCDVPRPLKTSVQFEPYRTVESSLQLAILSRFGLPSLPPFSVLAADELLLAVEFRDLMPHHPSDRWAEISESHPTIIPWSPLDAYRAFMQRFAELAPVASAQPDGVPYR